MNIERYNEVTEILKKGYHVNDILTFLRTAKDSHLTVSMEEVGFISHPNSIVLDKWTLNYLIDHFEGVENMLKQQFDELKGD